MSSSAAKVNDLSWMIGGPQGSGVDSSANVFARACAAGGLHIFGKREFYSNIMGEHSYFALRAHSNLVRSHIDDVNVLSTFEAETLFRHAREVTDDGAIIYDPSLGKTRLSDIPTIETRLAADLKTYLISRGVGETLDDVLAASKQRGVSLVPIPFKDLLEQIADEFQIDQLSKISRVVNMLAVGASFGILGFDFEMMRRALEDVFRAKAKVVNMNAAGARKAYDIAKALVPEFLYRLEKLPRPESRLFLTGSQATALGKLYGGMRFQTYYPITPASDESEFLEENELLDLNGHGLDPETRNAATPKEEGASILVVQTEDEIAAITMATGAALTGARSATATSGPGFCLMMEGIGWASINEVPIVITLYQRAGPSTGMPTRHEQGDLRFALHAGHGESPRILLASGDFEECIRDGLLAFNYADRYQMPVIHLVDKALANSYATTPVPDLSDLRIDRGALALENNGYSKDNPYKRFDLSNGPVSPRAFLGQEGTIFWNTGDEHEERGHITEDPMVRDAMMEKRFAKLDLAAKEIPRDVKLRYFGPKDAPTVIVSWGSTKGALLDALDRLWAEGAKVGYLHVRLINPFPTAEILPYVAKAKRRIGIEMNFGAQLAGIVRTIQMALAELKMEPHRVTIVSGIGCSAKTVHYVKTYGIHTLHGRALPYATGVKLANPQLKVLCLSGDGDGLGIGGGHFVNAGRRNLDMLYIIHDNGVYGLTKGQAAPTLKLGVQTKSLAHPNINEAVNPIWLALAAGATWVGRGYSYDIKHLVATIKAGIEHKGYAFLDVLQPCPTYNDLNTKEWYGGEDRKDAASGRPLPRVYKLEDEGYDPVVRDPSEVEKKTTQALEKALEWGDRIPIGVFYKNEHVPTFEERIAQRVPTYMDHPPALQPIAGPNGEPRTDLTRLLQRLTFKAE